MITPAMLRAAVEGRNIMDATPAGIELSEKAGQTALVNSTDMPLDMGREGQAAYEKIGFKFGDPIDDLFIAATLPPGWTREPTDHSMWSYILDEHGRKRVAVFYKAAFYDRKAHANLENRFSVRTVYGDIDKEFGIGAAEQCYAVTDCGKEVWRGEVVTPPDRPDRAWYDADEARRKMAAAWLTERYPDHADPTANWNNS